MKLFEIWKRSRSIHICDVLHDLVPFVQFRKRKKHPWRSVTFSKVAFNEQVMFYCHFDKTQARKKKSRNQRKRTSLNLHSRQRLDTILVTCASGSVL